MYEKKMLIVDDDPGLLELVAYILSKTGAQVYTATSGREGLRQFYAQQPDLVILDLMLPDVHGWEMCRQIRRFSDVPLIMLTVLDKEEDIIHGLDCGADDYVTKPFSPNVLLARVRAALRRAALSSMKEKSFAYNDGYLAIDLDEHRVLVLGEPVKLSVTEYRLLAYLLQNAGQVLTFRQILQNTWGEEHQHRVEYAHVYISRLRQKLEEDPKHPKYFLSERGMGYCFERQVTCLRPPTDSGASVILRSPGKGSFLREISNKTPRNRLENV